MDYFGLKLSDETAEIFQFRNRRKFSGKSVEWDTQCPNLGPIYVVLTGSPYGDCWSIVFSIHGLKEVVELSLQPTPTHLANKVKQTASHRECV